MDYLFASTTLSIVFVVIFILQIVLIFLITWLSDWLRAALCSFELTNHWPPPRNANPMMAYAAALAAWRYCPVYRFASILRSSVRALPRT